MKKDRLTADREVLEQYGKDFSICGKCKICQACHVQEVDHERFWRNCPSGTRFGFEAYYASGKMEIANAIIKNEITPTQAAAHALYTCMLCGSCEEQCYGVKQLYPLRVIELLRERAVRDGWGPPPEFETLKESIAKSGGIIDPGAQERTAWASSRGVKDLGRESAETMLFVGCQFAGRPELHQEIRAVSDILHAAKVDFGVMGSSESCCGSPLLEIGERDLFERSACENIEKMRSTGVRRIATACAHCAYTLKEEYARALDGVEILHVSELIGPAIGRGDIEPEVDVPGKVAYHDPCMLGRRLEVYDAPRAVLSAIPGLEAIEFQRAGRNSLCCGAGGMAWWAFPDYASWVAGERLFEADWVGASKLATACPQCQWMLAGSAKEKYPDMEVTGIWSLLAESLGIGEGE